MQDKIRSYNTRHNAELKKLLLPTLPQVYLYLILGIIILALLNTRAIWHFFTTGIDPTAQVDLGNLINEKLPAVYTFFDEVSESRFVQILFWLLIGCVAYIVVWFIGNFIANIRNDMVADKYVHPKSYNRAGYWGPVVARKAFFACLIFIMVAYVFVAGRLLTLLADVCYQATTDFVWHDSLAKLFGSLLLAAISIHVFLILLKLLTNSWQLISKDL